MGAKEAATPLRAVQAFGAVARVGSVVGASHELAVTASAVSHLVRRLERRVGAALLVKAGRGLKLTPEGERLAKAVNPALAAIGEALREFARRDTELRISMVSTFAVRWLIPRLSKFQLKNPDIELFLSTSTRVVDFAEETFDCAIRFGRGDWPGVARDPIYTEELTPACSPLWLKKSGVVTVRDLKRVKLLHARARRADWQRWLEARGEPGIDTRSGPTFETRDLAIQAAIAQMGIAVVDPRFIEAELRADQLVLPFTRPLALDTGYWLVWRPGREAARPLAEFRRWLAFEAGAAAHDASG